MLAQQLRTTNNRLPTLSQTGYRQLSSPDVYTHAWSGRGHACYALWPGEEVLYMETFASDCTLGAPLLHAKRRRGESSLRPFKG